MTRPATRISMRLPQTFDANWLLGFLRRRQAPAIEVIDDRSITKGIRLGGRTAFLRIDLDGPRLQATCSAPVDVHSLRALVRQMLDLDADLDAFARHTRRDPFLARLVRARPGLRVPQFLDPFECVVRAMIGQQVSVRAASTLVNRIAAAFASPAAPAPHADPAGSRPAGAHSRPPSPRTVNAGSALQLMPFPTAADLAASSPNRLRQLGLTGARSRALHAVAVAVTEQRINLESLRRVPGDEAQAALDALPGIGPWTAAYIRMRALGDRDAFPASDLGVLRALGADAATAERRSEAWRPWRAYAVMHLWAAEA